MNRREFLAGAALPPVALGAAAALETDFGSAIEIAEAIRRKKISSLELTSRCFERIAKYNPELNAIILQFKEAALNRAKRADEALARRAPVGPFHGVPVTVKESFHIAGVPTTWGLPEQANFCPKHNSALAPLGSVVIVRGNETFCQCCFS